MVRAKAQSLKSKGQSVGKMHFDPQALLDAVDAQRRERGMTWSELSQELHIATSTIRGMPKRRWGIELDGVIGLAHWVGRTVESFAGGDDGAPLDLAGWSVAGRFVRFDTAGCYAALNAERERRGMTWNQVAAEIWPTGPWGANQLKHMAKGGRADVYGVVAICEWLGRPIDSFKRETLF